MKTGYWPLYRFNPALADEGKNPFILESKAPDGTLNEFLLGENRYAQLEQAKPRWPKSCARKWPVSIRNATRT